MAARPSGPSDDPGGATRRPVGVAAAILALAILIGGTLALQVYAQALAARYVRTVAAADLPIKYLTLTFQRAALADARILPLYGSSELYWAREPRRAPQFFQPAPTGFSVFAVGHAGTGDLFFTLTFAALGADLRGKRLAVEDSSVWFSNPLAIPSDQYAGTFSPEIASMFLFDAPISLDAREGGARRMLDYPETLKVDDLLRAATEDLADPSLPHLLAYDALYPAGRLASWVRQVQDAGQTIAYVDAQPNLQPDPPVQPRPVSWPEELQTASRLTQAQATNNPFGIADDGFGVLKDNVDPAEVYSAMVLYCYGKTNRTGAVYGYPADFEASTRSSRAWVDLTLELRVLRELGAHPLVYGLPLAGAYDDYTPTSKLARLDTYDLYRKTTTAGGITALDLSGHDEDAYFLHDPIDHLSPRGWIFIDRALDVFWHQGAVEPATRALGDLADAVPPPSLPDASTYCAGSGAGGAAAVPIPPGQASATAPPRPWGDPQHPTFLVGTDVVLTNLATTATGEPGGLIPVTLKAVPVADLTNHLMFVARLIDSGGAVRSETTLPDGRLDQLPTGKWGVPRDYVLSLPVPTDAPRGIYRVQILAFRIPTWQALPMTRVGGAEVNQLIAGSVLIAPADYLPTPDLPNLGATGQSRLYRLGGELELVGATPIRRDGDRLSLDLFWRAVHALDHDDTIFLQLLDRNGRLVAQSDGYPWNGRYPTSAWQPGLVVRDSYQLVLPAGESAGSYSVIVGAYRLKSLTRLPVVDASGRAMGDHVALATIELP